MKAASEIFKRAANDGRKHLLESEAKTVCMEYGVPVTKFQVARDEEEAVKLAEELGFPVVLKIVSPDVIHKSDVGGVFVDLKTADDVRNAYRQILQNVKKHKADAEIEILRDVAFRVAPVNEDEAREMISEVKAYPLLKGYSNLPPADIEAIVKILGNTSRLVTEHHEIKELDLNQVMVYEKGAKAVDARIILE